MHFQQKNKYARLKMFLLTYSLVGLTLCLLQYLSIFNELDSLLLFLDPKTTYSALPAGFMLLVIMFHTLFPGITILEEGVVKGLVYTAIIWFFYGVLLHSYATSFSLKLPLIAPLLGGIISIIRVTCWECAFQLQEKIGVRKILGCYVEPEVADILLSNPDLIRQDGIRTTVTVMFADLRGFTTLCERITPEQVIAILRDCFGTFIRIVRTNGGTVDKLIGDCIMVVWGHPLHIDNHAEKAVESALEMQAMMEGLKKKWQEKLGVDIKLGIGINTDEVVAGTIGSEEFCDYTVLGCGVNLAARLESICPGDRIYVSQTTRSLLEGMYTFRKSDTPVMKSSGETDHVYQVLGRRALQATPCPNERIGLRGATGIENMKIGSPA